MHRKESMEMLVEAMPTIMPTIAAPVATQQFGMMFNNKKNSEKHITTTIIDTLIKQIINAPEGVRDSLRFGEVTNPHERRQVLELRAKVYKKSLPYLMSADALENDQHLDAFSTVYAIWIDDKVVATIRLSSGCFESRQFLR